jgi:hypothetical protein
MKRYITPVFLLMALLCISFGESKALAQLPSSPSDKAVSGQQPTHQSTSDFATETSALGDYVSFPAAGVKIRQPTDFEKDNSFDGFSNLEMQSSVLAITMQGPYSKVNGAFTQDQMKLRGWTLRSRQPVKVDNLPGILVHFEQPTAGGVFLKWSLIFGDEQKTTMVTAAFPKTYEKKLSAQLKTVVRSSTRINQNTADVGTGLPFTLTASKKLKITPGISKTLIYSKDGVIPSKSPMDPIFIAVPSLGKVAVVDKLQYAKRLLQQINHAKKLTIKSTQAIVIAGLRGYESIAEAVDIQSGIPLTIYQVILFDKDSYIRMMGLTKIESRDEYLPEFKALARSLQRK